MPQIADIDVVKKGAENFDPYTLAPDFARKDEARWQGDTGEEISRAYLHYTRRPADPKTGLVKHAFRLTFPTLKSVVTDPSGPYTPPPVLDYVSAGELTFWVHPRSSTDERQNVVKSLTADTTELITLIEDTVVNGKSVF